MTAQLDLAARYTRHPEAMETRLRDETVILHLQSGIYFGLDAVGTIVWDCLETGDSPENVFIKVRKTFADAPETVEDDVTAFLAQLLANDLIKPC